MISNNSENPLQLLNCINKILHRLPAPSLPKHVSLKSLCDSFSGHFRDKVSLICSTFSNHASNHVNVETPQINSPLAAFTTATVDEVRKIIMSSQNKSCDLDPLPTTLMKACLDLLINPITNIRQDGMFFSTPILDQNFTPTVSAQNLRITSIKISILGTYFLIVPLLFLSHS